MEPKNYINHSGGAKGADMTWDSIGRKYGVNTHLHWKPRDLEQLTESVLLQMKIDFDFAARALKRPNDFKGVEFAQRNWLQVRYADAIYAIAHIVPPGESDYQGFINETGKEIVAGGTGWAVEMAIQKDKPVCVFDMTRNRWYFWMSTLNKFIELGETPILTNKFAGIGSRILTPEGIQAIENVYIKTFKNVKEETHTTS